MPTTDQLQTEIVALTTRLNALDGQGLTDPSLAVVTVLAAKIAGVQTTMNQAVLLMESLLQDLTKVVDNLQKTIQVHLGSA